MKDGELFDRLKKRFKACRNEQIQFFFNGFEQLQNGFFSLSDFGLVLSFTGIIFQKKTDSC